MNPSEPALLPFPPGAAVLVADDHTLVREGVKMMLRGLLGAVEFVEAGDASSLARAVRQHPALRLALVDLNMPGMDKGFQLVEVARAHPQLPLVVVSALTSPDVVRRTLEIPTVFAFVPKSAGSEHMRAAIDAALRGVRLALAPAPTAAPQPEAALTPRMEEVRALLRQGMSNKLIARTLGISEGTVKNHMSEIFRVLNVSNRTQAAQLDPETL